MITPAQELGVAYGLGLTPLIGDRRDKIWSGVKLVGTGSTNFKSLLDETLLDELQEVNIDLVAKVDKLSMKVSQ